MTATEPGPPPATHLWITLRRAYHDWLMVPAGSPGRLLDREQQAAEYLTATVAELLTEGVLLAFTAPDEAGNRRVVLTTAGHARYQAQLARATGDPQADSAAD
jgi:hypothetical protein